MTNVLLKPAIMVGRLLLKAGRGLGHLGMRSLKLTGFAILAAVAIFLLDWLLVKDTARPAETSEPPLP